MLARSGRWLAALSVVLAMQFACARQASAHAVLLSSEPGAGAVLYEDDAPTVLRLVLSEEPEARLSSIAVIDGSGARRDAGSAGGAVGGVGRSLEVSLPALDRGVYAVAWRVVSRVDGHATSGTFEFGIGELPTGVAAPPAAPRLSWLEAWGRWTFLAGLTLLVGAAVVPNRSRQALGGWVTAAVGLAVLAEAQRRNAATSFAALWPTPIGRALLWRGAALVSAVPFLRARTGLVAVGGAGALAAHVLAGHAAGLHGWRWASVATQWAHAAAAMVWIGGLVALLVAVRGAPSEEKAAVARRFSTVAAAALAVVVATGTVAGVRQVRSWDALADTSYGRALVVKVALLLAVVALAAVNRWRNVQRTAGDLRGLRLVSTTEVALASTALLAAAVLAGLSPPVAALGAPKGLIVTGTDATTAVTARLDASTDRAGANRFTLRLADRDDGRPFDAPHARLDFRSLDDPSVPPTALVLRRQVAGRYVGDGNNVSVEGRWSVTVTADDVVVPLALTTASSPLFVTVGHDANGSPSFGVQMRDSTLVYFTPKGGNELDVEWTDLIGVERAVAWTVLTADGRQHPVRRLGDGRFAADVELLGRRTDVTANAMAVDGTRLRAAFVMDLDA